MSQPPIVPLTPPTNSHKKRAISYPAKLAEPEDISSTSISRDVHPLSISRLSATEQEKTGLLIANPFEEEETHSLLIGLPANSLHGQSEDITTEIASLTGNTDICEPQITRAMLKRNRVGNFIWVSLLIFVIATSIIYACASFVIAEPGMNLGTDTTIAHAGHAKIINTPQMQASVLVTKSPTVQYPSLIARPPMVPISFQTPIPVIPIPTLTPIPAPTPTVSQSSKPHGELLNRLSWAGLSLLTK